MLTDNKKPSLCVSIHDVAPTTWVECSRLLSFLDSFENIRSTLLVVPDYHRHGRIDSHPQFLNALENRLARGDEIALHGYYHLDDSPPPRNPIDWVQRRMFTQSEGEFAAISNDDALKRLQWGVNLMEYLGWPLKGFIAPAWLIGKSAEQALKTFDFAYTTTLNGIYRLPDWQFTWSPALTYSVGSPLRRTMSLSLNQTRLALFRNAPLLRLCLHPVDFHFDDVMVQWGNFIERALETHIPITKAGWISNQSQAVKIL
ncbi:MAG: polysaccharide deacetylase family protein [Pseudomonadota bacterium]